MRGRRFGIFLTAPAVTAALAISASVSPRPAAAESALDRQAIHAHYDNGDFDRVAASLEAFVARNPSHSHADSVFVAKHLAVVYASNPATAEKGRQYMYRLTDLLPTSKLVDMFVQDERSRIFRKVRNEFMARQHSLGVDTARLSLPDLPAVPVQPALSPPPAPPGEPAALAASTPSPAPAVAPGALPPAPAKTRPESHPAFARARPPSPAFRRQQQSRDPWPLRGPAAEEPQADAAPAQPADLATPSGQKKGSKTSYLFAGGAAIVAAAAVTFFVLSDSPESTERTYVVP